MVLGVNFDLCSRPPSPNPLPTERAFTFPAFLETRDWIGRMIIRTGENVIGENPLLGERTQVRADVLTILKI